MSRVDRSRRWTGAAHKKKRLYLPAVLGDEAQENAQLNGLSTSKDQYHQDYDGLLNLFILHAAPVQRRDRSTRDTLRGLTVYLWRRSTPPHFLLLNSRKNK